uniref:Uncharacterized protein n=1 Tax=Oryza meridionalis TaxID=40149 RepID=A0A0E0E4M7_9ORYZ
MAEIGGRRGVLLFSAAATAAARSESTGVRSSRHGCARALIPRQLGTSTQPSRMVATDARAISSPAPWARSFNPYNECNRHFTRNFVYHPARIQ